MYTEEMLMKEDMKGLVGIYNKFVPEKSVKRFQSKKIGVQKILEVQPNGKVISKITKQATPEIPKKFPSKPKISNRAMQKIEANVKLNNKDFANLSWFKKLCADCDINPTKRQASKFRMGKGVAYKMFNLG